MEQRAALTGAAPAPRPGWIPGSGAGPAVQRNRPALRGPLLVSSGVQRAAVRARPGSLYAHGIFVPRQDWRRVGPREVPRLFSAPDPRDRIHLFALPAALRERLWHMDFARLFAPGPARGTAADPGLHALCAVTAKFLAPRFVPSSALSLGYGPAGLLCTTFDLQERLYIGLHIDSLDKVPVASRRGLRSRFVANLGSSPRSFLFVDRLLSEFYEEHGAGGDPELAQNAYAFAHACLVRAPETPVHRIVLAPGEAYVAPVQNLIHDGCTAGARSPDLTLSCLVEAAG